jgi:hypothetical protein
MKNFHRITTQRGRSKSAKAYAEKRSYREEKDWDDEEDDFPGFSSNRIRKVDSRDIREAQKATFTPLRRWLMKYVGRSWDEMWHDLSNMDGKKFDVHHMKKHISYFIANPDSSEKRGLFRGDEDITTSYSGEDLYVDDDGILRKTTLDRRGYYNPKAAEKPKDRLWLSANEYCQKIDGEWYSFVPKVVDNHICWNTNYYGRPACRDTMHGVGKDAPKKIRQAFQKAIDALPSQKYGIYYVSYDWKDTSRIAIKLTKKRQVSKKFINKVIIPKLAGE